MNIKVRFPIKIRHSLEGVKIHHGTNTDYCEVYLSPTGLSTTWKNNCNETQGVKIPNNWIMV